MACSHMVEVGYRDSTGAYRNVPRCSHPFRKSVCVGYKKCFDFDDEDSDDQLAIETKRAKRRQPLRVLAKRLELFERNEEELQHTLKMLFDNLEGNDVKEDEGK